jgi:D-glycero-D-manno-heptose 1,7-bisphosphate phosphatase
MGKPRAPYTLEEFRLYEGVPEGITLLRDQGFLLVVVTNQPDVARGWVSREAVDAVNTKLLSLIQVDDIRACFHTEKDQCECRKPRPGMLLAAAEKFSIDMNSSWMIGDRYSDVEAGIRAGCKTILIGEGDTPGSFLPDFRSHSLLEAARLITKI